MDTNINYPIFNGQVPTGNVDRASFNKNFGFDQARDNYNFISGGNIYRMENGAISQIDTVANRQGEQAQQTYQAQAGSAVSGLQGQQGSLAGQYADLLKTVKGEYDPLINQTTQTAGAALSKRGLTPDSQLFQQETQGALAPIYGQEAANAQQIGQGSINDVNTLQQALAGVQSGNAQFGATLPLQYGQLALQQQALPSEIAANQGQAAQAQALAKSGVYVPTGIPGITFNSANNQSSVLGAPLNLSSAQLQKILSSLA